MCRVADPWGGLFSWRRSRTFVKAREILAAVDVGGGMRAHVESGEAKRRIEACAARTQARVDGGEDVVVGVNDRISSSSDVDVRIVDNSKALAKQLARLRKVRETRDPKRCAEALMRVPERRPRRSTASFADGDNLVARAIDCARVRCTLGEMSDALRDAARRAPRSAGRGGRLLRGRGARRLAGCVAGGVRPVRGARGSPAQGADRQGRHGRPRSGSERRGGRARGPGLRGRVRALFATPEEVAAMALDARGARRGVSTMCGRP